MQKKQKGEEEEVFVIYLDKNPITLLAWFYYRYFKMQMAMFPLHSFFQSIDLAGNCIRQIKFLWNNKIVREEFHVGDELRSCLLESRDLVSTSSSYLHLWSGQRFLPYCFQGWQGRDAAGWKARWALLAPRSFRVKERLKVDARGKCLRS